MLAIARTPADRPDTERGQPGRISRQSRELPNDKTNQDQQTGASQVDAEGQDRAVRMPNVRHRVSGAHGLDVLLERVQAGGVARAAFTRPCAVEQ